MKNTKYILGLSCFYHDSSAVIIKNSEIVSTIQEEIIRKNLTIHFQLMQ